MLLHPDLRFDSKKTLSLTGEDSIGFLAGKLCDTYLFCPNDQGKFSATVVCWILGLGSLVSWNSMLTIGDYYYNLFPVSGLFCFSFLFRMIYSLCLEKHSNWDCVSGKCFDKKESLVWRMIICGIYVKRMTEIMYATDFWYGIVFHLIRILCFFFFYVEIPSFKGSYSCLSTICHWNNGNTSLQWGKDRHAKEEHSWIYSFLCKHLFTYNSKYHCISNSLMLFFILSEDCDSPIICFNLATVGFSHIRGWRHRALCWHMSHCGCFWSCRCTCSRWNGWRFILYVSWIHPSKIIFSYTNWFHSWIFISSSLRINESSCHQPCSPSSLA